MPRIVPVFAKLILVVAFCLAQAQAQRPNQNTSRSAEELTKALTSARSDLGVSFTLRVDCTEPSGSRSVVLFPSGVAIWNGSTQVRVPADARTSLIDLLLRGGFADFQDEYGGRFDAKPNAAMRISCRVEATAGSISKMSVQQVEGAQFEKLFSLARAILDKVESLEGERVSASSLGDGVRKLAAGKLARESIEFRFVQLPGTETSEGTGSILRISGGTVSSQDYLPGRNVGTPSVLEAGQKEWNDLAEALLAADFGSLPANLKAPGYVEVAVSILGDNHTVIARAFSDLDLSKQRDAQKRFEALVVQLQAFQKSLQR